MKGVEWQFLTYGKKYILSYKVSLHVFIMSILFILLLLIETSILDHFKDVQEVQVRCRSLRDRFVKEYATIASYKRSGSETEEKTSWRYFKMMLFLKDIVKTRK